MDQNYLSINECKQCKYDKSSCTHGQPIAKCFSCFSRHHYAFLCPLRNTNAPKWFVPKIDKNLFTRFFKTFDPLEQYSIVISAPETLSFISLKKIRVQPKILINRCAKSPNDDTVLVIYDEVRLLPILFKDHKIVFDSSSDAYLNFTEAVSKKQLFIKARKTILENSILSHELFSLLLSPITKVLHCYKLTLTSNITFAEILQKMPNLEDLSLLDTNIEIGNEWVEDLKIYGKNIVKLKIEINDYNFNVKELAKIIKVST
uniref:Uncharacterized protein n=1 Tax=Panagrolaimus davidi TaxID=227884 RepID=A0A914PBP3_9BILA